MACEICYLQDSETIDVHSVATQARTGRETGRVPNCWQPGRVKEVPAGNKQTTKRFPSDPGDVISTEYIFVILRTAFITLVRVTRPGYKTAEQVIRPMRNERLRGWSAFSLSREVVAEEPCTDSQGGIESQGGVQQLSPGPALSPWL